MKILAKIIKPTAFSSWTVNIALAIPRILGGLMLALEFGASKFGMPWSTNDKMGLFEVADWFPADVEKFGFPFSISPLLFAWLGAATEAIGGWFMVLGLGTRFWSGMIICTMLTAIFFQKWGKVMEFGSSWPVLPAVGFLWLAVYNLILGSGKIGLDHWIATKMKW